MTWRTLRITTILIITQSLFFFPAPISWAQDHPTEAEIKQARDASNRFLKLLEETGDFSRVIDEMYAKDFIERYLREQTRFVEEENSSFFNIMFAFDIECRRDLLKQATIEDWRRLYIASNNFLYHVFSVSLNKHANDLLNDREQINDLFVNLFPQKVIALFKNHSVLKGIVTTEADPDPEAGKPAEERQRGVAGKESGPKPIETPEEMRSVTETIREGMRLLFEEQGNHSPRLTDEAKKAIEMIRQRQDEMVRTRIEISDKEYFGFPPGARLLDAPTPHLFWLTLAEINGKQKIVWAQMIRPFR
jgi:hypothetical protein